MTELDTIKRAKMYMEKLSHGINPLDGQPVPEAELINNVRLSRCFFFVAEVLRQVIDNGGTAPRTVSREPKLPLEIPAAQRNRFAYSDTPIPASEIARRITALAENDKMRKLSYAGIADWLLASGMLETTVTAAGAKRKRPTENGRALGITTEERVGQNGPYQSVVYNLEAQHFIMDNLDAILAMQREKHSQ